MNFELKNPLKLGLFLMLMPLSLMADLSNREASFKDEVLFNRTFVISPEVENWTNVFFSEFFKKEMSDLEIQFTDATDMSFGFIEGNFSSQLSPSSLESSSNIFGDFVFYVDPNDGKSSEYGFHFETEFEVQDPKAFYQLIQKDVSSCEGDGFLAIFCDVFKKEEGISTVSHLYDWKERLIAELYTIEDPEILAIQDDFVSWMTNQIVIEELSESVVLELNLSGLKSEFEKNAKSFFRETQLTDYSLQKLRLEFFEDSLVVSLHLRKLHVASRARLYVELMSGLQNFIEDEERGIGLAQSLREALSNKDLSREDFTQHIYYREILGIGVTAGTRLIIGEGSTEAEEELGLE